jgi:hypothetical protein
MLFRYNRAGSPAESGLHDGWKVAAGGAIVWHQRRRSPMTHRGISFSVSEMEFPGSWKWAVGQGKTISVGVCATRAAAVRQAKTFIESIVDWVAA